jgi:hypothetical protein
MYPVMLLDTNRVVLVKKKDMPKGLFEKGLVTKVRVKIYSYGGD